MESPQQTSNKIQFLLNGELISVTDSAPTQSLLYFLREKKKLVGTKEACAEGDCGACTVVIAELVGGELQLHTANACIQFLPTLNGKSVFTVESLRQEDGNLHPVQQSMVDNHGSQCGFCTPGFIMSLWNIYNEYQAKDIRPTRLAIKSALAGNLCRCTGYRPIIDAAEKMFDLPKVKLNKTELRQNLAKSEYADATILAGGTDVGLWVNKQLRKLGPIIYVGEVAELKQITTCDDFIRIGAGASISDVYDAISHPGR